MFNKPYCKSVDTKAHQESLSAAALHTVVSALGGSWQSTDHTADVMGIDAKCTFEGCFSPKPGALQRHTIDFQLKSTRSPESVVKQEECWTLRDETAQLQKYLESSNVPLILALLILPQNVELERCVEVDEEKTLLKKCLYWTPLEGFPLAPQQKKQTVYIPKKMFSPLKRWRLTSSRPFLNGKVYVMQDKNKLNIANKLDVKDVERLLCSKGWEPLDAWDDIMIYRRPQVENVFNEVVLPKSKNDKLYASYLLSAAEAVAEYEKLSVDKVLTQWSRQQFDCMKFRLISDKVENGTAPLYCVQSLVSGAFDALKAAVKDVEKSCHYHARVNSSNIQELMERAEFGQTEKGSYVINVLVPNGTQNDESSFEETQERVYRKGVEHLIKALDSVVRFAASESPNDFLTAQENENVSSNLLESVLKMRCEDDAELEISVDWSPLLPPSNNMPKSVHITKEHVDFMSEWAQTWRPKKMEETRQFVGKVVELLGRGRDVDSKPFGTVVFSIFDDEKNYEAEAELDVNDYQVAHKAHYDDALITFRGKVVKGNRKARFFEAENLRRVET